MREIQINSKFNPQHLTKDSATLSTKELYLDKVCNPELKCNRQSWVHVIVDLGYARKRWEQKVTHGIYNMKQYFF